MKTEQTADLAQMAGEFLKYKGVQYKSLTAINVNHSNVIIGYKDGAGKQKWVEFNLSFILSFIFQAAKEKPDESEYDLSKLHEQYESLGKKLEETTSRLNSFLGEKQMLGDKKE